MTSAPSVRVVTRDVAQSFAAFAGGVALLAVLLSVAGFHVGPALTALWDGAFGSWYNFTSAVLVRATPLIILGLAFTLGSKAGAINIGMEGQFAAGAAAATWAGLHLAGVSPIVALPAVLAAGLVGGAAWVGLPVMLRVKLGVSEIISTLLLNFVAVAGVSYLVTGPLQEPSRIYPQSEAIAASARLPQLALGSRLHAGLVLAVILTSLLSVLLNTTATGFRLRAAGAGPLAARIAGRLPVSAITGWALLWSGALAGLGGAVEIAGVSYALYQNLSPGYGFTAIAVALLGRLQPWLVLLAGVMFGALEAGAAAMQRDADVPAVAVQVVEAVIIIVVLLSSRRRR